MSIKDLFGKKTVIVKSAESASIDAESNRFVLRKAEENQTFVPPVDFSTASNFIRFGSAEEYYESSVRRIYSEYPYDGSQAEKILFNLSSSYFDRHILEDMYPKTTGYAILNPSGYGASSITNGYGLNASSDDYEYIFIGGGVRPAPQNQNDPSRDSKNIRLQKQFEYGTFYEEGTDKTSVFQFNAVSGSTFEFWMKKNSFDTTKTHREVILDLWNGRPSGSVQYGRVTLELDATPASSGANPFRFTYQTGRSGVFRQSLASGSFSTSDIADGKWHHWAVSTRARIEGSTTYLDLKLYKDGVVLNKQSIVTTNPLTGTPQIMENIVGRLDGHVGALIAPVASTTGQQGAKYAGKLSASLDEVRFWKRRVSSHEIYNNWYHPIGGGANTDKYRETLALYYKFNEGITLTSSIDSTILDYSGRVANGKWTGYNVNSRNTGSCFVSASVLNHEPLDPIIRSNHNSIKSLIANLKVSGSQYDVNNPAYMYDMVPFWMREEDFEIGDNNLKKIYQILASYFDTLYLQIESLPDIKSKRYFEMDKKPYPFSKQLLEHNGLIVPDLFISQGVLEKFSQRDDQNKKFEANIEELKQRIYYNIYNNLKTIYESKGTEKSYRNMLRCFGIDDEIVKLNLYTDYGIQYLTDKVKYSSQKTKFINHNVSANFTGRVYNTSSVGNPKTFISGSGPLLNREKDLAFTLETDVIIPTKFKVGDLKYFPTDFLTSSIMGFHQADPDDVHNFNWHAPDTANLQVHLVRPIKESDDAKFVITNNAKTIFAESETFKNIYNNERWALGLKVYPVGYPWTGHVANTSTPQYVAELYGVTHNLNDVQREFTIKATMSNAEGKAILINAKRFYTGCEATNFTGTPYHYSDLKIGACRLWYDKLDNAVLKQHNLDASNYGHNKIHGNATPYVDGLKDVHVPSAEALAFNWDFQQVTASDSSGRFVVEDFSSGTSASRYGWIDDLILRENRGGGRGYGPSSKKVVDNEFVFSAKKELPEISFTSDGVFIKGDEELYFSEDEDTTDNVFAFEKSMYQVVSEEVLKTFSTVTEYANLFMKPVDHYREEYKRLDHFKELYFERVEGDMDFEKFTNYFKFIDGAVSVFIQQLHPAMAKFNEGISDIVESHILERPKYKRQFPFVTTRDTIPDGKMAGIGERTYPWREGHAPDYREEFDENDHCWWQKERRTIKPSGSAPSAHRHPNDVNPKLDELRKVIVSETDGKAKNLGTTPPYSQYTIVFGDGAGGGGMPAAGENITFAFPSVSLLVSFNGGDGSSSETAFSQSTANELKIDVGDDVDWSALGFASAAERVASIIRTALINYTGAGLGPTALDLAVIPDLTANSSDRILVLTANRHGHYGLTFSDNATNIIITNISNTARPTIYQGSTYAVRSFSRQYKLTYDEQKTIHGGTNYGHQKNRDFVLDHLKPHGGIGSNGVPQEVITVGVGEGLGVLGLDKCKGFSAPYGDGSGSYSEKHLQKAEYRFVGTVGRYADGTGDQPKSDEVEELYKVKGHRAFPFNLVSGTIATGYNKKINDDYDDDVILTNLHSDTTTPTNDVPMQGPFAETWVGGRQFRHIPMNRFNTSIKPVDVASAHIGSRRALSWAATTEEFVFGEATLDSNLSSTSKYSFSFWLKLAVDGSSTEKMIFQVDPDPLVNNFGMRFYVEEDDLRMSARPPGNKFVERHWANSVPNDIWTHWIIEIDPTVDIDNADFVKVYKNNSLIAVTSGPTLQAGFSALTDKTLDNNMRVVRLGDLGNLISHSQRDNYELQGELQDFAIWNKELPTVTKTRLYNNGKSIWPNLAPSGSAVINWWTLGEEEAIKSLPIGSTMPVRLDTEFRSVLGQKSRLHFPTPSVISVQQGLSGHLNHTINYLDDQYTRPEAFRILVGDHPSEPIKDGALGMVGPDYGGPYPDTTRQKAVHYRGERAKRPFNIKNIQHGTASAILGNFKENYEVVHSVGRSVNNRKLVEFASVSSSLTSPMGMILPMTTNQATLFGSTPLLSGNVFGGTTNITVDRPRIRFPEIIGQFASGSMYFDDRGYFTGGAQAVGSFIVSGSTLLAFDTGSFTTEGHHATGSQAEGTFTLTYPQHSVSEGNYQFTGSTVHGIKASGSVTVGAMPTFPTSQGSITVNKATTLGSVAQGSFKVGTMPVISKSSGSLFLGDAFEAATRAVGGGFNLDNRTTYNTNYTGSFRFNVPPIAAARGYVNFKVLGTTMVDAETMTLNLGGLSKVIQADTNDSTTGGPDIVMPSFSTVSALKLDDTKMTDLTVSGYTNGNGFAVSMWIKIDPGEIPAFGVQTLINLKQGTSNMSQVYWGSNASQLNVFTRWSDNTYIFPRWSNPIPDDGVWRHVVLTFDGVNTDGTNAGSPNFHLYVNGVAQARAGTSENLTGAKAAADLRSIDRIEFGDTDIKLNVKDLAIWDHYLDSTDVNNIYNSGNYFDHTTHAHASNLVAYYTMSDPSDSTTTIQDATANNNDLHIGLSANASFVAAPYLGPSKTNTEIFDALKASLTTAYSGWTTEYIDIGSSEAIFYIHKDTKGASGGTASITIPPGQTTFTSIKTGNGYDAEASSTDDGDYIRIDGQQFEIHTTTSGSSFPHVNAASSYRKALIFDDDDRLKNVSWDYTWPASSISFTAWIQRPASNSDDKMIFRIDNDAGDNYVQARCRNTFLIIDQKANNDHDSYTYVTPWGDVNVGQWCQMTFTLPKDGSAPTLWINGVAASATGYANDGTAFTNFNNIYIGNHEPGTDWYWSSGMHDFAVWNTSLDQEDANVFYNSGSWDDLRSFNKAHLINNYWLLGSEQTGAVGVPLTNGKVVDSTIGPHQLTIESDPTILNGIAENWKIGTALFNELKTSIADFTSYQEAAAGVSTVSYTTGGGGSIAEFTLTIGLNSPPTAFTEDGGAFYALSGPNANGVNLTQRVAGATDGHYVQIGSTKFFVDSDGSTPGVQAAPFYAVDGSGDYHVFSNAADNATWWARFEAAVNAGVTTHTTTRPGNINVFDIEADVAGAAGNKALSFNGSSFTSVTSVAGGADEENTAQGKGFQLTGLRTGGSLDGGLTRQFFAGKDIKALLAAETHAKTYIQDGVWLAGASPATNTRRYYISTTGSVHGTDGDKATVWDRFKDAIEHGVNTLGGGSPVVNVVDVGGPGARLDFTGSYALTDAHDFTVAALQVAAASGDNFYTHIDSNFNGFGHPNTSALGTPFYETQRTFSISGVNFEFAYPHDNYGVTGGAIALRPTGSKSDLLTSMRDILDANVPNFDFFIGTGADADRICMTGSYYGGASLNNAIYDGAHMLVSDVTQTAGGVDETGVGHMKATQITTGAGTKNIFAVHTLASGSGTTITTGVLNDVHNYYILSVGVSNTDFWDRTIFALKHGLTALSGQEGTWSKTAGASSCVLNFVGAFDTTDDHDFTVAKVNGTGYHGADFKLGQTNPTGFGVPPNAFNTGNGQFLQIDNGGGDIKNFENVYPFNGYAAANGTNIPIRHTGSQSDYIARLNAAMSTNLTNFNGFQVDGTTISFTASTVGDHPHYSISNRFHGMSAVDIQGGVDQQGVKDEAGMRWSNGSEHFYFRASHDLRAKLDANPGVFHFCEDGVWRRDLGGQDHFYISSTGSGIGSDGVESEWVRRICNVAMSGSGEKTGQSGSFEIFSGSNPSPYLGGWKHQFNFTGSFGDSNAHDWLFQQTDGGGEQSFMVDGTAVNSTGYGFLMFGGVPKHARQTLTFVDGGAGTDPLTYTRFQFAVPHDNYLMHANSDHRIKTTGSVTDFFNRVSQSLDSLTNYTILQIQDMGSNTRKFTMRANLTGSIYNSDIQHEPANNAVCLVSAKTPMSGGHLQYSKFDNNYILLSHSGSKNHLFKLDRDGVTDVITNRTHDFSMKHAGGTTVIATGEIVTGSYNLSTATDHPDIIVFRGSTYRFIQDHPSNSGQPIVIHYDPITASAGAEIVSLTQDPTKGIKVTYFNDGSEVSYSSYVPGVDNDTDAATQDYLEFRPGDFAPNRLYYGSGNTAGGFGRIFVVSASHQTYISTVHSNTPTPEKQVWDRMQAAFSAEFPTLNFSYNDLPNAGDVPQVGSDTTDDYLPKINRAIFKITGSTNVATTDQTFIIAGGNHWSSIHQVTGATSYGGEGVVPMSRLYINWGTVPDSFLSASLGIAFSDHGGNNPWVVDGVALSKNSEQAQITPKYTIFSGSQVYETAGVVPDTSAWYLSSSIYVWDWLATGLRKYLKDQYTFTTASAGNNKWKRFDLTSRWRDIRFNFTGSDPNSATHFGARGLHTSSYEGGITILSGANMNGAVSATPEGHHDNLEIDQIVDFQLGNGEQVRLRGNVSGWRRRTGGIYSADPAKTIYWTPYSNAGSAAARQTEVRTSLSGAWSKLSGSDGVAYYQITPAFLTTYSSGGRYDISATVTGSEYNFVAPAFQASYPSTPGGHFSGSGYINGSGHYIASHYITGGISRQATVYYDSRINVNQREQALLEDGIRNKTIITSRFYGGGGPEVMTEAFLDVHAKEKSVYSALPYRNLHIKNDSGEQHREFSTLDGHGTTVNIIAPASIRVNSHAHRREGLNTLHSRHTGRFGLDSRHGAANDSDYRSSPYLRFYDHHTGKYMETGRGEYEASFHKVHRNTLSRPLESRALRVPVSTENTRGLINGNVQSDYPSNGYIGMSFWVKFDEDFEDADTKYVVEADDNDDENILIVDFKSGALRIRFYGGDPNDFVRRWQVPQPSSMSKKWNHFVIIYNSNAIENAPEFYINAIPVTPTSPTGTGTGNARKIAGRMSLMGNDELATNTELQGSMQDFAFFRGQLTQVDINEIYDAHDLTTISKAPFIIDYWRLGNVNVTLGDQVPFGTKIHPAIGSTTLTVQKNTFTSQGRGKVPRNDNFYVQSILPQSDYNYSWVETSLGSNYSVRSGKQKVFGYWPKDGILVRNIKKGAKGTYYETQVTASTYDSAINFPTGSDVHGS